jgi:hypothetical protein
MPKFKDATTNTDPLSVQLYFDENNSIKWNIILKNKNNELLQQNVMHNNKKKYNIDTYNENEEEDDDENDEEDEYDKEEKKGKKKEDIYNLNKLFPNIFIINAQNRYNFKYTNIDYVKSNNLHEKINNEPLNYNSFDYNKYNQNSGNKYNKIIAWKKYLNNKIDIKLDEDDYNNIDKLIEILTISINNKYDSILIILEDVILNNNNIIWLFNNLNTYELESYELLITSFSDIISKKNKIDQINYINKIQSFVLKNNIFKILLNKLKIKNISWESCLYQIVEEKFNSCFILNNKIFI